MFPVLTLKRREWQNRVVAAPQDPFYLQLGKRIKSARVARGFTQEKLARALKLTRTSITNIEAGKQPVFAHQLSALSRHLGVSVEVLLAEDVPPGSPRLDEQLRDLPLDDAKRDWIKRVVKTPTS